MLLWLLPTAALLTGILTYASIMASLKNIEYLRSLYDDYKRSRPADVSTKSYPHIQGPQHLQKWAKLPTIWVPIVFTIAWLLILARLAGAVL